MPWEWEQGNAARDLSYNAPSSSDSGAAWGQPAYGQPQQGYQNPGYGANQQGYQNPAYAANQQGYQNPGYAADLQGYQNPGYAADPYNAPQAIPDYGYAFQPAGYEQPLQWQDEQPGAQWSSDFMNEAQTGPELYDESMWLDPFTPAHAQEGMEAAEQPALPPEAPLRTERPPIRIERLLVLGIACAMLLFCVFAGGSLVAKLVRNEHRLSEAQDRYYEETGTQLHQSGTLVSLLPKGQTYVPTATPAPTFASLPTATPIIPINDPAAIGMNGGYTDQSAYVPEASAAPSQRVRRNSYPKNPLRNIREELQPLLEANPDTVGSLTIDDVLEEVVLQRNNTYYLTRSSIGTPSEGGSVFADESCSLRFPPENLILRGQSSVPGKVFEPLWKFVNGGIAFASAHSSLTLTTLYESERYFLFAVLIASSDPRSPDYFSYASQPTFATDEVMLSYVQSLRVRSLYPFGVDVQPTDRLLTLATVGGDNSLVLVYRMAREGE